MAGEKSAAITGCPACASGIAIDPAPHPISSTDSPGSNASSLIKSCAYGAVSNGRKCRALLSHSKESSARCRAACKRIHSSFQSTESSSERISPSATGHPPHNKKAAPPKKKSRNQHISERTVLTPNHSISQDGQKRSDCQRDRTQPRSRCAGAPPPGGRHIRSIASSARAGEHLMCSPCEPGLSEQATLYVCRPAAGLLARIPS